MAIIWKASIPAPRNGKRLDRSAPSAAASIPPARSSRPGGGTLSAPGLRALRKSRMAEAQAITASLGLTIPEHMMERRLNAAGSVVGHKISMLQDLERGRSLEIDALVTAVQEMGRLVKVATPTIDAVLALVQERGRQAGLYGTGAQR